MDNAKDADCGFAAWIAKDMVDSPFVDWWPESLSVEDQLSSLTIPGRLGRLERAPDVRGSEEVGKRDLWVTLAKPPSVAQRHLQVLIVEAVKDEHFGDRRREQFHRDGIGLQAFDILRQILVIDPYVPRLSRDERVLQSDSVCGAVVFCPHRRG